MTLRALTACLVGAAIALASPRVAVAGGTSWDFTVRSIEHHDNNDVVILDQTCEGREWLSRLGCDTFVLHLRYNQRQTWTQSLFSHEPDVTRSEHDVALTYLWSHLLSGEVVRDGEMGGAFRYSANDRCTAHPDAIAMRTEGDGNIAVYAESQDD